MPGLTLTQTKVSWNQSEVRTRYLGHVNDYQPIRDQYILIRSVPARLVGLCRFQV